MLKPELIDPVAFAKDERVLNCAFSLNELDGRVRSHEYLASADVTGCYRLRGGRDKWGRFFLELSITLDLVLICQRCLTTLPFAMQQGSRIYLFFNEAALDEAMAQNEELEGIVAEEELSLRELIEDEILMALPYSPKHEHCDNPDLDRVNQDKPNPFLVLSNLKS